MVMGIAGGLAGLAGSLVFQFQVLGPFSGTLLILKSFVVVIAGGAGSVAGTLLAAAIFGFMDTAISSAADPRFVVLADVMLMIIILLIRPKGLLGRGEA
jgi:branched-subunit amino acid ABC-type transport system permease component